MTCLHLYCSNSFALGGSRSVRLLRRMFVVQEVFSCLFREACLWPQGGSAGSHHNDGGGNHNNDGGGES